MRFELDHTGAWMVDPDALAERLGVSGSYLRSQEDRGLVLSRVETGSGADEGRRRVTVVIATYGWQGLFDRDGVLVGEQTFEPVSSFAAADRMKPGLH
ncbi:hypothetical protein GU700_11015 [Methylobacterium sp. NI91]|nr:MULTISPECIES: DUF6522 family protein [unclassified Methylobacterium]QIJ75073.1 hypothetical protein CLZ_11015 [Methylobacterium sp. CLZ]QIJ79977.1 hypothetical protein GU700_11015 [Methylobacterium sp. NI91]